MQQDFPSEFQWLAELAHDVNQRSGFYTNQETAAIYCANCQIIQAYCTGCGKKLIDVYDEETDSCENCGISLSHCRICGYELEEQTTAPKDAEPPEFWKYCPACGEGVFAVTDMCPHCKVSMGAHLDAVYEETIDSVNRVIVDEEHKQDGYLEKPKGTATKIPPPDKIRWTHFIFGQPYLFVSRHSYDYAVQKARQMTTLVAPGLSPYRAIGEYRGSFRQESHRCFATIQVKDQFWIKDTVSSVNIWLEEVDSSVHVTIEVNPTRQHFVGIFVAICVSLFLLFIPIPIATSLLIIGVLWSSIYIYLHSAFQISKLKQYLRILFDDNSL